MAWIDGNNPQANGDKTTTCAPCGKTRKHEDMRSVTRTDDPTDRTIMCRWCVTSMFAKSAR